MSGWAFTSPEPVTLTNRSGVSAAVAMLAAASIEATMRTAIQEARTSRVMADILAGG